MQSIIHCQAEGDSEIIGYVRTILSTPRYLPSGDGPNSTMCDPWEAQKFYNKMRLVPDGTFNHCLPDCSATSYQASVTSVPFRKCDDKNMGVSLLCDLTGDNTISPPIYGSALHYEYQKATNETEGDGDGEEEQPDDGSELPDYVRARQTSTRYYSQKDYSLFAKDQEKLTYDAYEKVRLQKRASE